MYQILLAYNIHKNKGTLVFHFLFYLKHIKDMECKSIWDVTSTCSNPCTAPVGNTEDDMASLLSESAAIPPAGHYQFLSEKQAFPYF